MRRFSIVQQIGSGKSDDPFRPNVSGNWVTVADLPGGWNLVKLAIPDGTAADAATIADLQIDADGNPSADVDAISLTAGQKTAIKNRLTAAGLDISRFDSDGVSDRQQFLRFVLRRLAGWTPAQFSRVLRDFDVSGP